MRPVAMIAVMPARGCVGHGRHQIGRKLEADDGRMVRSMSIASARTERGVKAGRQTRRLTASSLAKVVDDAVEVVAARAGSAASRARRR